MGAVAMVPNLLSADDVAVMLRCSTMTVGNERRAGRLGFVRIGGRYFYTEALVAAYIASRTVIAAQEATRPESPDTNSTDRDESETIGSPSGQTAPPMAPGSGTVPGMTQERGERATQASGLKTFGKLAIVSPSGT